MISTFFLPLLAILPLCSSSCESELIDHLMHRTSRHVRPVINISSPIVVTFGFELVHLLSLIEREQTLTVKVWMRMTWKNEVLTWQPSLWGNINVTKLNYNSIWTPDIFLQEDMDEHMSSGPQKYKTQIKIKFDGTHVWMIPVLLRSSCIVDVTSFPFDQQKCILVFNSWTHDQTELDIQHDPKPIITSNYINSTEWELINVDKKITVKKYECCPKPFVDIVYTITLDRKALYYIYHIVIPCIIQMLVILFTFFLPPDCGERIGVVITVVLVFAVYLEVVSGSLPKASNYTPALSRFYLVAMGESACSLIATCMVLVIHFNGTAKKVPKIPAWVRLYVIDYMGRHICLERRKRERGSNEESIALNSNGPVTDKDSEVECSHLNEKKYIPSECFAKQDGNTTMELCKEVKVITALIHELNSQEEAAKEWHILAKVVDCIFFYIFLFTYVVSCLVILVPLYIVREKHLH